MLSHRKLTREAVQPPLRKCKVAQNKNPSEVVEEVQQKLGSVMCVNWVVWFPVQAINLSIVPLPYRVLVANCVGFCYGIFLSYAANNDEFGE